MEIVTDLYAVRLGNAFIYINNGIFITDSKPHIDTEVVRNSLFQADKAKELRDTFGGELLRVKLEATK